MRVAVKLCAQSTERAPLVIGLSDHPLGQAHEVFLRGIMEAPFMDADKPMTRINLAQKELNKARAQWTAEKARRIAENDALNRSDPGDNFDRFPIQP